MRDPQEWRERVVGALGAVLVVAVAIGGVIGAVTYGAARLAGLTDSGASSASGAHPPTASPTPSADRHASAAPASPTARQRPHVEEAAAKGPGHHARRHRRRPHRLTLTATPHDVHRMGRVDLAGSYPGHGGTQLVVQRLEGGHWDRFPVTVVVRAGHFRTWVASGFPGRNRFRVVDPATGATSKPVTFTVH